MGIQIINWASGAMFFWIFSLSKPVNTSLFSLNDIWRTVQYVLLAAIHHKLEAFCSPWVGVLIAKQGKWHCKWNKEFGVTLLLNHINGLSLQGHVFCLTMTQTRKEMLQPFTWESSSFLSSSSEWNTVPTLFLSNPQISKSDAKCTCSGIELSLFKLRAEYLWRS